MASNTQKFKSKVEAAPSTASQAGFNLQPGVAPSTPTAGDVWFDGIDFYGNNGTDTISLTAGGSGGGSSYQEPVVIGTGDGVEDTFTLPGSGSAYVWVDHLPMFPGVSANYVRTGDDIVFNAGSIPPLGTEVRASCGVNALSTTNATTLNNKSGTPTPTANEIPVADSNGKLNDWVDEPRYDSFVEITSTPYTITGTSNVFVEVNMSTSVVPTINLPTDPIAGQTVTIKDKKGEAPSYPITFNGNGKTIDGSTSRSMSGQNFPGITLVYSGTEWKRDSSYLNTNTSPLMIGSTTVGAKIQCGKVIQPSTVTSISITFTNAFTTVPVLVATGFDTVHCVVSIIALSATGATFDVKTSTGGINGNWNEIHWIAIGT